MKKIALTLLLLLLPLPISGAENQPAAELVATYGSLPKGLTLEGDGEGVEPARQVTFEKASRRFILDGRAEYTCPIETAEALELLRALQRDDRLGLSLGKADKVIPFGALSSRGSVIKTLHGGDTLFGGLVFARTEWLTGLELPERYTPQAVVGRRVHQAVVYANFHNYRFEKRLTDEEGNPIPRAIYHCSTMSLDIDLIPISDRRAPDGGHLPDMEKMERGIYEAADQANYQHLLRNKGTYGQMPRIAAVIRLGEVAAFLRALKAAGIDLKALERQMR